MSSGTRLGEGRAQIGSVYTYEGLYLQKLVLFIYVEVFIYLCKHICVMMYYL